MFFFFDLDGTLIDSESIWIEAIIQALRARGVDAPYDMVCKMETGRSWPDIFVEIHTRWPQAYETRKDMEAVTTAYYQKTIQIRDIAIHPSIVLLKRLAAQGHAVAIVTGSVRDRVRQVCRQYSLESCVRDIVSCEDYTRGKPHPECYLTAAARAGIIPADGCAFEDAPSGVAAAKAAGMRCVALAKTPADTERLAPIADVVLPSLDLFTTDMLDGM